MGNSRSGVVPSADRAGDIQWMKPQSTCKGCEESGVAGKRRVGNEHACVLLAECFLFHSTIYIVIQLLSALYYTKSTLSPQEPAQTTLGQLPS